MSEVINRAEKKAKLTMPPVGGGFREDFPVAIGDILRFITQKPNGQAILETTCGAQIIAHPGGYQLL